MHHIAMWFLMLRNRVGGLSLPLARNVTVTFRPAITATPAYRPQVTASVTFTAL